MAGAEGGLGRLNGSFPDGSRPHVRPQLRETEYDGIAYVYPTWEQMGGYSIDLAKQIIQSGQSFDRIVALARGGWTWSRPLLDALKVPSVSSIRYTSYEGGVKLGKPKLVQPLTDSIDGERVILLDEVIDTGETMLQAEKYLQEMGPAAIRIAALCYKPRSEVRPLEIKPDFFAFESSAWVVFPHEPREFIEDCIARWSPAGLSRDEIRDRIITIGMPLETVEVFFDLE